MRVCSFLPQTNSYESIKDKLTQRIWVHKNKSVFAKSKLLKITTCWNLTYALKTYETGMLFGSEINLHFFKRTWLFEVIPHEKFWHCIIYYLRLRQCRQTSVIFDNVEYWQCRLLMLNETHWLLCNYTTYQCVKLNSIVTDALRINYM